MPSSCSADVLRAYFANGTLPPTGTVCETDFPPFSGASLSTSSSSDPHSDVEKTLGELLAEFRTNVSTVNANFPGLSFGAPDSY